MLDAFVSAQYRLQFDSPNYSRRLEVHGAESDCMRDGDYIFNINYDGSQHVVNRNAVNTVRQPHLRWGRYP